MKYDPFQKQTLSARRTLLQLRKSLVARLMKIPFETITVQELCEDSMISKSTFYSYFDDKYDLLRYFFQYCKNEITQSTDNSYDPDAYPRLLDYVERFRPEIKSILRHNPSYGSFQQELLSFLTQAFERIAHKQTAGIPEDVPLEVRAKVNTYAFLSVINWAYMQDHKISREQVTHYLNSLHF